MGSTLHMHLCCAFFVPSKLSLTSKGIWARQRIRTKSPFQNPLSTYYKLKRQLFFSLYIQIYIYICIIYFMYGRNVELIFQLLKWQVRLCILMYTSICIKTLPLKVHTHLCQCTRTLFVLTFVCACIWYSRLKKKKSLIKELWPREQERECQSVLFSNQQINAY